MIHFRHHNSGFTFFEIIITLFMLASVLSALFVLQESSLRHISNVSMRIGTIFELENLLAQKVVDRAKGIDSSAETKTINKTGTTMQYEAIPVAKDSSLSPFEHIVIEKASAQWRRTFYTGTETMITFLFKPPEKK